MRRLAAAVIAVLSFPAVLASSGNAGNKSLCTDLAKSYDSIRKDAVAGQRSALFFSATAKGCEELVTTLLADGASLEAKNRLGTMPLAVAAAGGATHCADTGRR